MKLSERLRALSCEMKDIGVGMMCLNQQPHIGHGNELIGAAEMVDDWIKNIQQEGL